MSDKFQSLMDRAYARWQSSNVDGRRWTQQFFWEQLDPAETVAVMLGNMNYQVGNGGWTQWGPYGNAYGCAYTYPIIGLILTQMVAGGSETADKVRDLFQSARDIMDVESSSYDDDDWEEMYERLSILDSAYYTMNDQFVKDIEAFLVKNFI